MLTSNTSVKSRKGHEPVFSIAHELVLNNFRSIYPTGLDDPALMSATMVTFVFAVTGAIDGEFLEYQSQAFEFYSCKDGFSG
jgi:hypothetical protein